MMSPPLLPLVAALCPRSLFCCIPLLVLLAPAPPPPLYPSQHLLAL